MRTKLQLANRRLVECKVWPSHALMHMHMHMHMRMHMHMHMHSIDMHMHITRVCM